MFLKKIVAAVLQNFNYLTIQNTTAGKGKNSLLVIGLQGGLLKPTSPIMSIRSPDWKGLAFFCLFDTIE